MAYPHRDAQRDDCTKEDFVISATLDAYEGDTRVFTRTWDGRVPRKLV